MSKRSPIDPNPFRVLMDRCFLIMAMIAVPIILVMAGKVGVLRLIIMGGPPVWLASLGFVLWVLLMACGLFRVRGFGGSREAPSERVTVPEDDEATWTRRQLAALRYALSGARE